ncbi:MAG: RluA family pseudouridine synthase [Clostridia bacterium]|nr:RluA family pseudouridine synthase [Clostridia bacterium]
MNLIADTKGIRLDVFVSENADITRSAAQKLICDGNVYVNGKEVAKNYKLNRGDSIKIEIPEAEILSVDPEDIPLDILYEDNDVIVVNKPQGMVVHPAVGNLSGTLVNALMHHAAGSLSAINGVIRPGIVHRIDKDTSGILVVAKNNDAHLSLAEQIKEHSVKREYVCLIHEGVKEDSFTVDKPIGRSRKDRKKMGIEPDGRNAVTHFTVLQRFNGATLLSCRLETGRTHQIRVHLSSMGCHIVGDPIYGLKKDKIAEQYHITGQLLHAKMLGFVHPRTNEYMEFSAPVPEYFERVLEKFYAKSGFQT